MRILFVHPNYPSQFRRLAPFLANAGHDVRFLAEGKEWHADATSNVRLIPYKVHRHGGSEMLHPYLRRFEQAVLHGQASYRACQELLKNQWKPDWVINHVGFGPGLYLRDVFPNANRAALFEWYYNADGADVDFLNRGPVDGDRRLRLRTWNAQTLLELADVDCAVTPTVWQQQQFPSWMRSRLNVIHEGIDVDQLFELKKSPALPLSCLPDGDIEVVTYVSRGFEEYRGFPQAMKALALLQKRRPNVHVLIVGSDVTAYGPARSDGRSWQAWAQEEVPLDPQRTHWLGPLQTSEYHQVLALSHVHLYLTVPFVLSWSLLEAMAAGCSIVSSLTPPVQEVMSDGKHGLLCDFYSFEDQASAMYRLLEDRVLAGALSLACQEQVRRYDSGVGLERWNSLLSSSRHQWVEPSCQPVC